MTEFKKLTDNFTVIPNQIFSIEGVSVEARYVYIYLRSKPSTWFPHMVEIQRSTGMGRARVMRCRQELIDAGMLSYQAKKEGGGVYTLHEITGVQKADNGFSNNGKADTRKPDSGKADSGFSNPLVRTDLLVNTDINKISLESEFNEWWACWPAGYKKGRKPALAIWKRIKPDVTVLVAAIKNQVKNDGLWLAGFIPNPTTYLNQERWNDDLNPIRKQAGNGSGVPRQDSQLGAFAVERGLHEQGCAPQSIRNAYEYRKWIAERI